MFFGGGENFFHWLFDDINIESASKYVAGKHRILITMNIYGSYVIMPPTSKKLEEHIASGTFCVRASVVTLFDA